mgnify:FL=1
MIYSLQRWIIWIYRWRHCRGFGVQSPSDYSFIRYVINEHYPYYAYEDLKTAMPSISPLKRKKAELLFRIANWRQASSCTLLLADDEFYPKYIHYGCNKTQIISKYESNDSFVVISALSADERQLLSMLDTMQSDSILVIDDLDNRRSRLIWDKIIADEKATISFDLYYIGIVMKIDNRYKHNYIVNF